MPGSAGTALLASLTALEQRLLAIQGLSGFEESNIKSTRWRPSGEGDVWVETPLQDHIKDMLSILDEVKKTITNGINEDNIATVIDTFQKKFPKGPPQYLTDNKYFYIVQLAILQFVQQIYDGNLIQAYVKEIWSQIPWGKIAAHIKKKREEFEEKEKQKQLARAASNTDLDDEGVEDVAGEQFSVHVDDGIETPELYTEPGHKQQIGRAASETSPSTDNEAVIEGWIKWALEKIEKSPDWLSGTVLIPLRGLVLSRVNSSLLNMIDAIAGALRDSKYTNTYIGALNDAKQQVPTWGVKGNGFKGTCESIHKSIAELISKEGVPTFENFTRTLKNIILNYQYLQNTLLEFPDNLIGTRYHKVKEQTRDGTYVDVDRVESWYFIDGNQPPQRPVVKSGKQPIPLQDGRQTKGELIREFRETEEAVINCIAEHFFPKIAAINTRLLVLSKVTSRPVILRQITADIVLMIKFFSNQQLSILLPAILPLAFEKYKKSGQAVVDILFSATSANMSLEGKLLEWLSDKRRQVHQMVFADYKERNFISQAVTAAYPAHAQLTEAIAALQTALAQSDITSEALGEAIRCVQKIRAADSNSNQEELVEIINTQCDTVAGYNYFYDSLLLWAKTRCEEENVNEWAKLEHDADSKIKIAQAKIGSIETIQQTTSPVEIEKIRVKAEETPQNKVDENNDIRMQAQQDAQVSKEAVAGFYGQKLDADLAAVSTEINAFKQTDAKLARLAQAMELLKKQHNDARIYVTLGNYIAHTEIFLTETEELSGVNKAYLSEILSALKSDFVNDFQPRVLTVLKRNSQAVAGLLQNFDNQNTLQLSVIKGAVELRMKNLWLIGGEKEFLSKLGVLQAELCGLIARAAECVEKINEYNEFKAQCTKSIIKDQVIISYDDALTTIQPSVTYLQARLFELAALKSFLTNPQLTIEALPDVRQQLQHDHALFCYYCKKTLVAAVCTRDAADKTIDSEVYRKLQKNLKQETTHPLAAIPAAHHETVNQILVFTVKAHDLLEELTSDNAEGQIFVIDYQKLEVNMSEVSRLLETIREGVGAQAVDYLQAKHIVLKQKQQSCQSRVVRDTLEIARTDPMQPMYDRVRVKPVLVNATSPEPDEITQILHRAAGNLRRL